MTTPEQYDERQRRIIEALTDKGMVLADGHTRKTDFRIDTRVVMDLLMAERLLGLVVKGSREERRERVSERLSKEGVRLRAAGGNPVMDNFYYLSGDWQAGYDWVYIDLTAAEKLLNLG